MRSFPYPKIETLFERIENSFVVDTSKFRNPIYGLIKKWGVTEKIDGMNIRVTFQDQKVYFGGKSDNASIPTPLLNVLQRMFTEDKMKEVFHWEGEDTYPHVVIYGEGYGGKIQGGRKYREDMSFRVFDILIDGIWWLDWDSVVRLSKRLGVQTVPYLGEWPLDWIIDNVREGFLSDTAQEDSGKETPAEGVVGRTEKPLFFMREEGKYERVILKLKQCDFKERERGKKKEAGIL